MTDTIRATTARRRRVSVTVAAITVIAACASAIGGAPAAASNRAVPITVSQVPELPGYDIFRPARLGTTHEPLPVIAWANGGCSKSDGLHTPLLRRWAEAGFVVVAITTPPGVLDPNTVPASTADDQAKAIDWAFAADKKHGGAFAGHLDLHRIVAAGNSCGGVTTMTLAARDNRVDAVFVLSGSSSLPVITHRAAAPIMRRIHVPVGYVIGGPEDFSTPSAKKDFRLVPAGVPAFLAHRVHATHLEVSTDASILEEVAEISTTWLDFALHPTRALERTLLKDPCGTCPSGTWTVKGKDLTSPALFGLEGHMLPRTTRRGGQRA